MGSVPQSQTTMSAMLTMLATFAVFLFDGGCAVALLFILVCGVALLQSRLIEAAGHWTQHGASAIQLKNSRNMSRTCTSAAELFYLRHTRSCAATACGNKGGGTSHSIPLQLSGADFIARLLQSVCQQVCLTIIVHWGRVLLALFRPSARLLQSIRQMVELSMASCAIRLCTLTWLTPLELAACAHVVNAAMHWDLFTCSRESIHHQINAATEPSAQEIATITLALLILSLSVADWHVPRWLQHHQLLCQLLTAMCMHTLRMDCRCTMMAFLLPTFGRAERTNPRANPAPHSPTRPHTHPSVGPSASYVRKSELLASTGNTKWLKVYYVAQIQYDGTWTGRTSRPQL